MTHPSTEWVLDQVASVVTDVEDTYTRDVPDGTPPVRVRRVDRDTSRIWDGDGTLDMSTPIRERSAALEKGVYIGVQYAESAEEPIGTEYDLDKEVVVGVRLEGLTSQGGEWGHVDPEGADGVPWHGPNGFLRRVKAAIYAGREYPDADPDVGFTHLTLANEADQSSNYADYYRTDFDVVFDGFETL
ncbi:hypothetical protein NDI56_03980 [Haloarcula sp. S1CR25-12]|uniref:Uncharacterized protein n=1 Tax=Haloarcula saliterrae TaxID=2950534 RepID=A0ABU2F8J3_9EURY|nr:hypothetical protein [Haloarcula sp. S1CR25-12]MDS0258569.1 hypothetical protein [Haloarcula sp. S1CR25-12]